MPIHSFAIIQFPCGPMCLMVAFCAFSFSSSFLAAIRQLEETDDINSVTEYFSYEHFYVIYCKFWELDRDHDLKISKLGSRPEVVVAYFALL